MVLTSWLATASMSLLAALIELSVSNFSVLIPPVPSSFIVKKLPSSNPVCTLRSSIALFTKYSKKSSPNSLLVVRDKEGPLFNFKDSIILPKPIIVTEQS